MNRAAEADPFNFPPRVKLPILMLNGRYDFLIPRRVQEPEGAYGYLGTPREDKDLECLRDAATSAPGKAIKDTTDFLDKYLGPVE